MTAAGAAAPCSTAVVEGPNDGTEVIKVHKDTALLGSIQATAHVAGDNMRALRSGNKDLSHEHRLREMLQEYPKRNIYLSTKLSGCCPRHPAACRGGSQPWPKKDC